MTEFKTWENLRLRCRKAAGPDAHIDGDVAIALDLPPKNMSRANGDTWLSANDVWIAPHFSGDLGALKLLIKSTLPGWAWKLGTCCVSDDAWIVPDFNDPVHGPRLLEEFGPFASRSIWDTGIDIDRRPSGNEELALLEAYCTARVEIAKRRTAQI